MKSRMQDEGQRTGPLFLKENGGQQGFGYYDGMFNYYMACVKTENPRIVYEKLDPIVDTSLRCSWWRGSTSEVLNQNSDAIEIYMNNI